MVPSYLECGSNRSCVGSEPAVRAVDAGCIGERVCMENGSRLLQSVHNFSFPVTPYRPRSSRFSCEPLYRPDTIRAQFEPHSPFDHPKRSPYRAPFLNTLKSAVFCQSDELKQPHIAVLRPDSGPGWVFD